MSLSRLARSVWRVGSGRPRIAIFGGVHGNERTGVAVVKQLVERFSKVEAANGLRGQLTLVIGNPDAVQRDVRFVDVDLNRCFADGLSKRETGDMSHASAEHFRARELYEYLSDLDVLVDLHATNKPSVPFARLPGKIDHAHFDRCERWFLSFLPGHCTTVLWDPRCLIGGGRMSDECALRQSSDDGAFICYESGIASDVQAVPAVAAAIEGLFAQAGLLQTEVCQLEPSTREWTHYEISEVFKLDERGFEWMNGHGQVNFGLVPAGEVYGRRGIDGPTLAAHEDSYIVFPKVASLWAPGKPLGWLARRRIKL